ncbi:MAG: SdpI family protein [Verrucomicrobiota bacterium]
MITLSITYLLSGLLVSLVTLPLIYGKIPMNALYGFRVKQTFESDTSWYHLNEIGGMIFSMLGFPLMLSGILGFFLPETMVTVHSTVTVVITLLSIGFAVCLFMRYAIRYQKQNQRVETTT